MDKHNFAEILKIHGYVSSDEESDCELKTILDEKYKANKPPPIFVDEKSHEIIDIPAKNSKIDINSAKSVNFNAANKNEITSNLSKSQKKRLRKRLIKINDNINVKFKEKIKNSDDSNNDKNFKFGINLEENYESDKTSNKVIEISTYNISSNFNLQTALSQTLDLKDLWFSELKPINSNEASKLKEVKLSSSQKKTQRKKLCNENQTKDNKSFYKIIENKFGFVFTDNKLENYNDSETTYLGKFSPNHEVKNYNIIKNPAESYLMATHNQDTNVQKKLEIYTEVTSNKNEVISNKDEHESKKDCKYDTTEILAESNTSLTNVCKPEASKSLSKSQKKRQRRKPHQGNQNNAICNNNREIDKVDEFSDKILNDNLARISDASQNIGEKNQKVMENSSDIYTLKLTKTQKRRNRRIQNQIQQLEKITSLTQKNENQQIKSGATRASINFLSTDDKSNQKKRMKKQRTEFNNNCECYANNFGMVDKTLLLWEYVKPALHQNVDIEIKAKGQGKSYRDVCVDCGKVLSECYI